jgi:homocysteine S-methyltransferase
MKYLKQLWNPTPSTFLMAPWGRCSIWGHYTNVPDELNLVAADLVREVHTEYVRAGADIIETNTYSATANKLQPYGLEGSLREINIRAAQIAREAAGNRAFVAGAVGPLGLRIEPYGPTSFDEARQMFSEQASALLEGGVDLFVLETFSDLSELQQAINAVRGLCDLPIVAQVTIRWTATLFLAPRRIVHDAARRGGSRCHRLELRCWASHRPEHDRKMRPFTTKKLSAQPNAGLPRDVQGRQFYMCSPEYMAEYSRRIIQAGAKFVGGCCGTTPAHIKMIADAIRQFSPRTQPLGVEPVKVAVHDLKPPDVTVVPQEERSNWSRKIARGEFVTTVEVLPPKGCDPWKTLDQIRLLKTAGVDGVNIPDGPRAQTRMGAMATAVLVEREVGMESVLHYCCRDRNLLGMMSDLLGAAAQLATC